MCFSLGEQPTPAAILRSIDHQNPALSNRVLWLDFHRQLRLAATVACTRSHVHLHLELDYFAHALVANDESNARLSLYCRVQLERGTPYHTG